MSFYQNLFTADFRGNLVLGDRQYVQEFLCPGNKGRGDDSVVAWQVGPYNLGINDADGNSRRYLNICFAYDGNGPINFQTWSTISVDLMSITPANSNAVQPYEILASLQDTTNNSSFTNLFTATLTTWSGKNNAQMVKITSNLPYTRFHFYIITGQAEEAMQFNVRSGVAELPTYFNRHTIGSTFTFTDSLNCLLYLNPSTATQAAVIDNAQNYLGQSLNYSHSSVQADWQLLGGKSGIFQFTNVVSASEKIVYSTGAKIGDLAMKIVTNSGNTFQLPYTLTSGDLITPP